MISAVSEWAKDSTKRMMRRANWVVRSLKSSLSMLRIMSDGGTENNPQSEVRSLQLGKERG